MAKIYRVTLSEREREALTELIGRRSGKALPVKRAYILLAADTSGEKNWTDRQIGETYGVSVRTIERTRRRFVEESFEVAVWGKKRELFKEKVLDGHVEARLIALRCSQPPAGYVKWSMRLLAEKMVELEYVEQISRESVRPVLKKMN